MEKIKAFFSNTITKIVAWVVLAVASICLIIGGATAESISSAVTLVAGVITAVSALVAFITSQIKK